VISVGERISHRCRRRGALPRIAVYFVATLLVQLGACKEPLPSRNDPTDLFNARIEAQYFLSPNENVLLVFLTFINKFDETFQDTAIFSGSIRLELGRNLSYRKTVTLGDSNLILAKSYDRNSRVLTIDPGDSIRLRYRWNFIDDNDVDWRTTVFRYRGDTTCALRNRAFPENIVLNGILKIYKRTDPIAVGPSVFSLCYVSNWVDPRFCPPIRTDLPCTP